MFNFLTLFVLMFTTLFLVLLTLRSVYNHYAALSWYRLFVNKFSFMVRFFFQDPGFKARYLPFFFSSFSGFSSNTAGWIGAIFLIGAAAILWFVYRGGDSDDEPPSGARSGSTGTGSVVEPNAQASCSSKQEDLPTDAASKAEALCYSIKPFNTDILNSDRTASELYYYGLARFMDIMSETLAQAASGAQAELNFLAKEKVSLTTFDKQKLEIREKYLEKVVLYYMYDSRVFDLIKCQLLHKDLCIRREFSRPVDARLLNPETELISYGDPRYTKVLDGQLRLIESEIYTHFEVLKRCGGLGSRNYIFVSELFFEASCDKGKYEEAFRETLEKSRAFALAKLQDLEGEPFSFVSSRTPFFLNDFLVSRTTPSAFGEDLPLFEAISRYGPPPDSEGVRLKVLDFTGEDLSFLKAFCVEGQRLTRFLSEESLSAFRSRSGAEVALLENALIGAIDPALRRRIQLLLELKRFEDDYVTYLGHHSWIAEGASHYKQAPIPDFGSSQKKVRKLAHELESLSNGSDELSKDVLAAAAKVDSFKLNSVREPDVADFIPAIASAIKAILRELL